MRDTTSDNRPDLLSEPVERVQELLDAHFRERGERGFRVRQMLAWLYERDAMSFDEMTDLPAAERAALAEGFRLSVPGVARADVSSDGTVKHLWRLGDDELVESVLIPAGDRLTLCLSSQAGCAMACVFCATGWSGYRRNLTAGEIVAQYRGARHWARAHDRGPITNLVFMGMGEPLMNLDGLFPALTLLNQAYGVGARRITVSTVGVVPGVLALARRPEQFRLAVSLHAPDPELRHRLVPIEKKYPMPKLLEALREFDGAGGRRITFEYVMLDGVNDDPALATQLARIAGEFRAHVNLIPFNAVPGSGFEPSLPDRLNRFAAVLEANGVAATIRSPRGRDIAAACGQLRAEHALKPPKPFLALQRQRNDSGTGTVVGSGGQSGRRRRSPRG